MAPIEVGKVGFWLIIAISRISWGPVQSLRSPIATHRAHKSRHSNISLHKHFFLETEEVLETTHLIKFFCVADSIHRKCIAAKDALDLGFAGVLVP